MKIGQKGKEDLSHQKQKKQMALFNYFGDEEIMRKVCQLAPELGDLKFLTLSLQDADNLVTSQVFD